MDVALSEDKLTDVFKRKFKGKNFRPSGALEDVLIGQTPHPPMSAIVRNFQTPTPPSLADVLIECPLT